MTGGKEDQDRNDESLSDASDSYRTGQRRMLGGSHV
jgi:hypothetical protein